MVRVIHESRPVARKEHQCCECGTPIEPGTQYARQRNTDGGDVWTYKAHLECYEWSLEIYDPFGEGFTLQDDRQACAEGAPEIVRQRLLGAQGGEG